MLDHILWLSIYGVATETRLPADSGERPLLWLSARTFGKTCATQLRKNKVVKFTVWVSPVQNKQTYSSKMLLVSLAIEPFWKRKAPQKSQCNFKFWRTLGVRFSSQNTANTFFRINLKSEWIFYRKLAFCALKRPTRFLICHEAWSGCEREYFHMLKTYTGLDEAEIQRREKRRADPGVFS